MSRFCRYLAVGWRLKKLSNIAPKHIESYAAHLKKKGKSASTIKTDLAAIRFFHDKISEPRNALPDNSSLTLSRRKLLGFDRTWSSTEFNLMLGRAMNANREDYVCAMYLAYYALSQATRQRTSTSKNYSNCIYHHREHLPDKRNHAPDFGFMEAWGAAYKESFGEKQKAKLSMDFQVEFIILNE